jgi:hypothetical protein
LRQPEFLRQRGSRLHKQRRDRRPTGDR